MTGLSETYMILLILKSVLQVIQSSFRMKLYNSQLRLLQQLTVQ